jgi:class 3 adenylate cyclase/Tfp pilus assembly protein PilF
MNAPTRRLAAVWFADVAGFTRLSNIDEPLALRVMDAMRASVRASVATHHGTLIKFLGDGALAEFPSAEGAVEAAVEAAARFKGATRPLDGGPYKLHLGIHVGDVAVASDGDIFGDGVNRAARLQALAEPGQILVSEDVVRSVRRGLEFQFTSLGQRTVKGLEEPFEVLAVEARGAVLGRMGLLEQETRPLPQPGRAAAGRSWARGPRAVALGIAAGVIAFTGLGVWTAIGGTTEGSFPERMRLPASDSAFRLPAWPEPIPVRDAASPRAVASVSSSLIAASLEGQTPDPAEGTDAAGAAPPAPARSVGEMARRANTIFRGLRDRDLSAHETLPLLRAAVDVVESGASAPAQAHASRGLLLFAVARDCEAAEAAFLQALSADPASGPVRRMYAQLLTAQGRFSEAHFQVESARPSLAPGAYEASRGAIFFREGKLREAKTALERALDRNEDALATRILLARTKIQRGEERDAIEVLNEAVGSISVTPWVAYAQLREKDGNLSATERARFIDLAGRPETGMVGALIYLELGQVDRALAVLDQRLAVGDPDLMWLGVDPEWSPLREDQRFLRRVVRVFET